MKIQISSKKPWLAAFIIVVLAFGFTLPSLSKDGSLLVRGPVVAIQRGKTDTRLIEPESFADLAEIYMVRVDHWPSLLHKDKFILVEYVHHTGLIEINQFDRTRWIFELHPQSDQESRECQSWIARGTGEDLTFLPRFLE